MFINEEDVLDGDRKVSCAASSAKATKAVGESKGGPVKDKHLQKRFFVVDSGASVHFIAKGNLLKEEWEKRKKLRNPQILKTANGRLPENI